MPGQMQTARSEVFNAQRGRALTELLRKRADAQAAIDTKYATLSGAPGEPRSGLVAEVGDAWSRSYEHGAIYWAPQTGAHWVLGGIYEKYVKLGGSSSFLGVPLSDEQATPDGVGRFTEFRGGSVFWHPDTGAFEVRGAIRERWLALGREQSFLGYPISDEQDVSDGGRASAFEHGAIYFWSDVGAIELKGVIVSYVGIFCFGETDNDQGSDSDEPYVVIGTVSPPVIRPAPDFSATAPTTVIQSQVYSNVDAGQSRPDGIEIYRGQPNGLGVNIQLMEHDDGDPDKYKAAMEASVSASFSAVTIAVGLIPVAGPIISSIVGPVLSKVAPDVGDALNSLLDTGDDNLGNASLTFSTRQLVLLAARTGARAENGLAFKQESPLLSGENSSYKVYLDVTAAP